MKIEILERGYVVKDKLRGLITKKLEKMEKYLGSDANCRVVCSATKQREKMEVNVKTNNMFVRSEVESDNMYANLDVCLARIEKQVVKHSTKLIDRKRNAIDLADLLFFDEVPEFKAPKITKRKDFELSAMNDDDAVEALELLDKDFYVYKDKKTDSVKVVYRRNDGDYGVIATH
ncbi:MAG: ribosome-associated translation inhibitor RaiA [Clostridia bacterium]|nr:ribosome-associated translation inhibitor RaiA [Clostridia bacterium]